MCVCGIAGGLPGDVTGNVTTTLFYCISLMFAIFFIFFVAVSSKKKKMETEYLYHGLDHFTGNEKTKAENHFEYIQMLVALLYFPILGP